MVVPAVYNPIKSALMVNKTFEPFSDPKADAVIRAGLFTAKAASPTLPYPNAHIVANLRGAEYGGDVRCPLQDEHDGAASEYTI
eukprot:scaffold72530_cov35-Tisochrysis_lutea.AAC.2